MEVIKCILKPLSGETYPSMQFLDTLGSAMRIVSWADSLGFSTELQTKCIPGIPKTSITLALRNDTGWIIIGNGQYIVLTKENNFEVYTPSQFKERYMEVSE